MTVAVGGDEVGVGRAAGEDVRLGYPVVDQLGRPVADVPGGPLMDLGLMPDEVPHLPARAAGDAGLQPGGFRRVGQQRPVTLEGVNVRRDLHAAYRPIRAGQPAR